MTARNNDLPEWGRAISAADPDVRLILMRHEVGHWGEHGDDGSPHVPEMGVVCEALIRALAAQTVWSTTPPTEPGYYWTRDVFPPSEPAIVVAFEQAGELCVRFSGLNGVHNLNDYRDSVCIEWAGPLVAPRVSQ
jgi:hypothetical protein